MLDRPEFQAYQNLMTDQSVSTKTRRRRPEARPDEIMAAALELFAARGFDATRMEDVARAAKVSKGAIYLYFPDKTSLLKSIILTRARGQVGEGAANLLSADMDAPEALRRFLGFVAGTVQGTNLPHLLKLVIAESRAHPEIGRFYLESVIFHVMPRLEALLSRGMAAGEFRKTDPALTARCIVAPMLMAALWKAVFEPVGAEPLHAPALAEHCADLIIRGLAP